MAVWCSEGLLRSEFGAICFVLKVSGVCVGNLGNNWHFCSLALRSMQCQIFCHQGTLFDIIVKNGGLLTVADSSD